MAQTRGSQAFATAVKERGGYRRTAALLRCSVVAIHFWISGKRRPSSGNLVRLRNTLDIPINWWFEPVSAQDQEAA
jgi:transcriptional regulator with XRE-family HTH domain